MHDFSDLFGGIAIPDVSGQMLHNSPARIGVGGKTTVLLGLFDL
jgi:hypothetical protein